MQIPRSFRLVSATVVLAALALANARAAEPQLYWFRGNTHTHSLWSDGNDFPEMIADWYKQHGYHFLALSDHNILSKGDRWITYDEIVEREHPEALSKYLARFGKEWVQQRGEPGTPTHEIRLKPLDEFRTKVEEPGKFLMIQGEEISDQVDDIPVHINATNLVELLPPLGGKSVTEVIENNLRAAEEQEERTGREILVHLNHPNFQYAVTAEDIAPVIRERFMEIYNGHPGVGHLGDHAHASVEEIYDIANTIRVGELGAAPLYCVATDDSHHYDGAKTVRPGRGWIMVHAEKLEPETLIRAIEAGNFYASSGVTLKGVHYDPDKKTYRLEIEPVPGAEFVTRFIGTRAGYNSKSEPRVSKEGKPLRTTRRYSTDVGQELAVVKGTSPTYQLKGDELYVRAVVTSSQPHGDPSFDGQHQQAWTQPVAWEKHVAAPPKP